MAGPEKGLEAEKRGGEVKSMKKETLVRKNIKPEPDITTMADEGLSMQKDR